jgi:uncharacterized membrane protein
MAPSPRGQQWLAPKGRIEAFSDGVFAIAITLLVLELRPPEAAGEFMHELLSEWPSYLAYLAAFVMIGSVWLHHHLVFARVRQVNIGALLVNLVLLLTVSVLPFPTAVLSGAWRTGDNTDRVVASMAFALISVAMSASYLGLCTYLARRPELLGDAGDSALLLGERRRSVVAIVGTLVAAALAFVSPMITLILLAVTPLYYLTTVPRSGGTIPQD